MTKTFMVATPVQGGDFIHGFVTGPDDADLTALWFAFRREFGLKGSYGYSPTLIAAGYSGIPEDAFAPWLIDRQGFQQGAVEPWYLTPELMDQPATPAQEAPDPALLDIHHAGSTYKEQNP